MAISPSQIQRLWWSYIDMPMKEIFPGISSVLLISYDFSCAALSFYKNFTTYGVSLKKPQVFLVANGVNKANGFYEFWPAVLIW